jgi:N-acetylmuramoyl-L-alanine amidase
MPVGGQPKVRCRIITCPEWGAVHPKSHITVVDRATRIIFHHTAGHHRELSRANNESRQEAINYAKDIQAFHMKGNGWIDSGHNFLVCRNGLILQGRWLTVSAIEAGHMVISAHCPGQNDQIGIEHEHISGEAMTTRQRKASARLMAWIADQYKLKKVLSVDPHSKHFATACPDNLVKDIPKIKQMAQSILNDEGRYT